MTQDAAPLTQYQKLKSLLYLHTIHVTNYYKLDNLSKHKPIKIPAAKTTCQTISVHYNVVLSYQNQHESVLISSPLSPACFADHTFQHH